MKYQPNRNYESNDEVQTPYPLAKKIVSHFNPSGRILEPCKGEGNFIRALPHWAEWCEQKEGKDFLLFQDKVDWIITNPPWSQIRLFLNHAMKISNNVVFLMTVNHLWTKARLRDIRSAEFGIREIFLIDTPKEFGASGFQLAAIHLQKSYAGDIKLSGV